MGACVSKAVQAVEVVYPSPRSTSVQDNGESPERFPNDYVEPWIDERTPKGFDPEVLITPEEKKSCRVIQTMKKHQDDRQLEVQHLIDHWEESGVLLCINSHVFSVPSSSAQSVNQLSRALTDKNTKYMQELKDTFSVEVGKAYAIYFWIINNIGYEMNKSTSIHSCSEIMSRRLGTPKEFASLFHALCDAVELKAYIVEGYLKKWISVTGQTFRANEHNYHCWNMVSQSMYLIT